MDDRININLQIEGHTIPLTVLREEEQKYRDAAKQVTNMVNAYRAKYQATNLKVQTVSLEKLMVMIAFQCALHSIEVEREYETEELFNRLDTLSGILEKEFAGK